MGNRRASILRVVVVAGFVGLGLSALSTRLLAQTFPDKPVRLVVPYTPGGATDVLARTVGTKLSEKWGQPVIVENRPGAGGTIGANQVAKASPDGFTALFTIVSLVQQMKMMKLPYDPMTDFIPISRVAVSPSVFAVPKDTPVDSMADFVKFVKANPNKHNYGTYGPGTSSHLQGAVLNMQSQLDLVHVPFQGAAPLITAMLGGQLSSAFLDAGTARPHLQKFKVLGTTGPTRVPWLADVPTLKEQGFHSYDPLGWFGVFLPAKTPQAAVDIWATEIRRALALPDVKEKIESMGLFPAMESRAEFVEIVKRDAATYGKIVTDANVTLN